MGLRWLASLWWPSVQITGRNQARIGSEYAICERGVWLYRDLEDDNGSLPVGPILSRRLNMEHAKQFGELPEARVRR